MTDPTIVDTATAATAAGVRPATVRDWVRRGLLAPVARGRFNLADVYAARSALAEEANQRRSGSAS